MSEQDSLILGWKFFRFELPSVRHRVELSLIGVFPFRWEWGGSAGPGLFPSAHGRDGRTMTSVPQTDSAGVSETRGHVGIVIVNWRGWKDTIECLESVFRMRGEPFRVIVCDNASGDGSVDALESWAQGHTEAQVANPELAHLSQPPVPKPVQILRVREEDAFDPPHPDADLVLLEAASNGGFAAGCNLGIRYALADKNCACIWLLNNDTVVDPDAMVNVVRLMRQEQLAMCGSLCLFYWHPSEVQAFGGLNYNRWTGRVKVRQNLLLRDAERELGPRPVDYINGASWFLTRSVIEKFGLLQESYFLYCEELDYASRLDRTDRWSYALDSFVYHKAGATAGSARSRLARSETAERYATRSRLLVCRRFFPWCLPSTLAVILVAAAYRILRGCPGLAKAMFRGLKEGLTVTLTEPSRLDG